jgi:hypothetical protein
MNSNTNKQNLWCRNKYCQHINTLYNKKIFKETNGCYLKECKSRDDECRGAHSDQIIKILPNIYKFNSIKKNSIDWVKIYLEIIDSINKDKSKIHNLDHLQKTSDLSKYNFIELIQMWRELACYYRKIAKSLPSRFDDIKLETIDGFEYKENVPQFPISDNIEDIVWGFERLTRWCPVQQKFNESIDNSILITIWDVCLATGVNCKEGIHKKSELICKEDFLTGRCSCDTVEQINEQIKIHEKELEILNEQAVDTSWSTKKSKKKSDSKSLILSIENKINDLKSSRSIHYSEQGMISFNEQYKNYLINEDKKKEEIEILEKKKLEEINIQIKPVIKLVKFGKKN